MIYPLDPPALATVLTVNAATLTVALLQTYGAGETYDYPALNDFYQPGDTVLVLFTADDPAYGYVAGRAYANAQALRGVDTGDLADGAVATAKIVDSAVTADKLANGSVDTGKLVAGAVGTTQLADGAVATVKLAAGAVTAGELAGNAVATHHLAGLAAFERRIVGEATNLPTSLVKCTFLYRVHVSP